MEHFYRSIQGWFSFPRLYREAVRSTPDGGKIVEIGSWRGKSLAFLVVESINSGKSQDLIAIDPWSDVIEGADGAEELTPDEVFAEFRSNLRPVEGHYDVIRATSIVGSSNFGEQSIDFVFIDASHAYADVLDDLKAWYPKVRPGGIIAGHDYHWPEVRRAVVAFCSEKGWRAPAPSELCWVIRVPPDRRSLSKRIMVALWAPLHLATYFAAWLRLMVLRRIGRKWP